MKKAVKPVASAKEQKNAEWKRLVEKGLRIDVGERNQSDIMSAPAPQSVTKKRTGGDASAFGWREIDDSESPRPAGRRTASRTVPAKGIAQPMRTVQPIVIAPGSELRIRITTHKILFKKATEFCCQTVSKEIIVASPETDLG